MRVSSLSLLLALLAPAALVANAHADDGPGDGLMTGLSAAAQETASLSADSGAADDSNRFKGATPELSDRQREMMRTMHEVAAQQVSPDSCDSPVGTPLGTALGVTAYSNCNDNTITMEDHTCRTRREGQTITAVTGMKWQCVEYARRSIFIRFGVLFGNVIGAVDIWRQASVHKHSDVEKKVHFARYRNHDDADRIPAVGSLVIYPIQKDMPFGHVAVIAEVVMLGDDGGIDEFAPKDLEKAKPVATLRIAEQNYSSKRWPEGKDYGRELTLVSFDGEYYAIEDGDGYRTLGWMTVEPDINPMFELWHPADARDEGVPQEIARNKDQATG